MKQKCVTINICTNYSKESTNLHIHEKFYFSPNKENWSPRNEFTVTTKLQMCLN